MQQGKAKVKWHGEALLREIRAMTSEEEKKAAQRISVRLQKRVPVRQKQYPPSKRNAAGYQRRYRGSLKRSIRVAKSRYREGGWIAVVGNAARAWYAWFVEAGTVYTSRQKYGRSGEKYMRDSANLEKRRFVYQIKKRYGGR